VVCAHPPVRRGLWQVARRSMSAESLSRAPLIDDVPGEITEDMSMPQRADAPILGMELGVAHQLTGRALGSLTLTV